MMMSRIRNEMFLQNYTPYWFRKKLIGEDFNPFCERDERAPLESVETWERIFELAIEDLKDGKTINGKGDKNRVEYWEKQKKLLHDFIQSKVKEGEYFKLNIDNYGRILRLMNERAEQSDNKTWFFEHEDLEDFNITKEDIQRFYNDIEKLKTYYPDILNRIEFSSNVDEFKYEEPAAIFYGSFLEIFHDERELENLDYFQEEDELEM